MKHTFVSGWTGRRPGEQQRRISYAHIYPAEIRILSVRQEARDHFEPELHRGTLYASRPLCSHPRVRELGSRPSSLRDRYWDRYGYAQPYHTVTTMFYNAETRAYLYAKSCAALLRSKHKFDPRGRRKKKKRFR